MIITKHIEKELSIQITGVSDEKIKTNKTESIQNNIKEENFSWVKNSSGEMSRKIVFRQFLVSLFYKKL